MIRISSQSVHPDIACHEEELLFIGTPGALKGSLTLDNQTGDRVFVRNFSIKTSEKNLQHTAHLLHINSSMQPGEIRKHRSRLTLDAKTPPGTYQFQILVGAKERPVRAVVLPNMAIRLHPSSIQLIGIEAGKTHRCEIRLENTGNLPFCIPNVRHAIGKDRDLMCRNLSKTTVNKGREGIETWLNSLLEGISSELSWIEIDIAEAGEVVQPGESCSLHITFTLPKNIEPGNNYEGHIRIHNQALRYSMHPGSPAAKPAAATSRPTQTKSKK